MCGMGWEGVYVGEVGKGGDFLDSEGFISDWGRGS